MACDADGKVNPVRYEAVNAMLLNEFFKEYREVKERAAMLPQHGNTLPRECTATQQIKILSATVTKGDAAQRKEGTCANDQ